MAGTSSSNEDQAAKSAQKDCDDMENDMQEEDIDEEPLINPCRCTFVVTGAQTAHQSIFICRTCCDGKELLCICEACANHCHELHDELEYVGMGQAYCDCSCLGVPDSKDSKDKGNGCKLWKISEQEVKEWKFPVGSIQASPLPEMVPSQPQQEDQQDQPQERQYTMDAFHVQELQSNTKLCKNLVEQASELVTHSKETFWLDPRQDQNSWCDLEKMAWRIYQQNAQHYGLDDTIQGEEAGGAEWWVQVKEPTNPELPQSGSEAVDLHYDKDELLAEKFGLGSFPTLSTVTYLTDSSNPTVILSRTYEQLDDEVIPDMLLSHPVMGKHLVFDGRLLHGAPSHPELRSSYKPAVVVPDTLDANTSNTNTISKIKEDGDKSKETQKKVRVTLLVNLWSNRKPAGVHPLDQTIRDTINKKFHNSKKVFKKKTDFSSIVAFEKVSAEEILLESEAGEEEEDETRRIQLPFVCKGITWESEDDDGSESGLVLVTCPPPEHTSDTVYLRFGPGLQAYLDQPYDAIAEGDGIGGALDSAGYVYEDAYM